MSESNEDKLRELLQKAMPPLGQTELQRDLWPTMLRRLDEHPVRVAWFDWALLALLGVSLGFFPEVIPVLLYHL